MFRELLYFIRLNAVYFISGTLILLLVFSFGVFIGFQIENQIYTTQEIKEIKSIIEEDAVVAAIGPNINDKNVNKELNALESVSDIKSPKEPIIEEKPEVEDESALVKWRGLVDTMRKNQDGVKAKLYMNAESYWTENGVTNYSMTENDYKDQLKSFDDFLETVNQKGFDGTMNEVILMQAFIDYPFDYDMIMYVYRKELKAYNNMH